MATARSRRRGTVLIWVVITLPVMLGFCSLAVDWGRVVMVRSELRHAADTSARYAASALPNGIATVRARAKDAADDNFADGTRVVLADADVEQGNWAAATKTFTPNGSPVNAVRVTARRTGANAVPLMFARALGKASFDVQASAVVAYKVDGSTLGFVGLNGITFHNNAFVGSYNSGVLKTPAEPYSTGKANIVSNATIQSHNNTVVKGDATLGPAGTLVSTPVSGTTKKLGSAITAPADPAWNPAPNPLGLHQNYTLSSPATWPGGTYWFKSLRIEAPLSFSGPATIYVDGHITAEKDAVTAYQRVPSNLKLYQLGNNRKFEANNNFEFVGQVIAPRSDFVANNGFSLFGTALFRTIELKNNAEIFLDEQAMSGGGGAGVGGGDVALVP